MLGSCIAQRNNSCTLQRSNSRVPCPVVDWNFLWSSGSIDHGSSQTHAMAYAMAQGMPWLCHGMPWLCHGMFGYLFWQRFFELRRAWYLD